MTPELSGRVRKFKKGQEIPEGSKGIKQCPILAHAFQKAKDEGRLERDETLVCAGSCEPPTSYSDTLTNNPTSLTEVYNCDAAANPVFLHIDIDLGEPIKPPSRLDRFYDSLLRHKARTGKEKVVEKV